MTPEMEAFVASMPFTAASGLELDAASASEVVGRLAWAADRCTVGGVLHGGALMAAADSLGAICAFLNLPDGAVTSTIESKTNLFRAVRDGEVTFTTRPLHVGRTTIVVQTNATDRDAKLVAQTTQTQVVTML